jgi:hypothetical protein
MSAAQALMTARAAGIRLGIDGVSIVLEADNPPPPQILDMLRAHKPEIIDALRVERSAIIRYLKEHFESSPPGRCAYCGGDRDPADPFVVLFCGTDPLSFTPAAIPRGSRCRNPRRALGIDPADKERRRTR